MVKMPVSMIRNRSEVDRKVSKVEVKNPMLHTCTSGKFVDFEIELESTDIAFCRKYSCIRRRYSEFIWLRNKLSESEIVGLSRKLQVPELPPKRLFGRFEALFLRARQQGLKEFLDKVLKENSFLSFSGFHLFLQSDLTVKEIDDFLNGKFGEYLSVDSILESRETSEDGGLVKRPSTNVATHENCKHILVDEISDFMNVNYNDSEHENTLEDDQSLDSCGSGQSTASIDSHDYRALVTYK